MRSWNRREPASFFASVGASLYRARRAILIVGVAYLVSAILGAVMVHAGNGFALERRDALVSAAQSGAVLTQRSPVLAGLIDAAGNLLGGVLTGLLGLGIVLPFPMILYRGWVGGIVSVDGQHLSRLTHPAQAAYYLSVMLLQLVASSLAGGAGLHVGLANLRSSGERVKWLLGLPKSALSDAAHIYIIAVPLFLIASLWEFLSPLN